MNATRFLPFSLLVTLTFVFAAIGCGSDSTSPTGSGGSGGVPGSSSSSSSSSGSTGGTGGAAGHGGTGGTAGNGGTGGGDGGIPCTVPADCPGQDTDCQKRTCDLSVCGVSFTADGTSTSGQTAGDCKDVVCDGAGMTKTVADDGDLPDDDNPCTDDICDNGDGSNVDKPIGTSCGVNLVCDGAGACIGCNGPADCPGVDDACKTRTCTGTMCGFNFAAQGTALPQAQQTAGDCKVKQCDGNGNTVTVDDDNDKPNDNKQCTGDVCTAGVPSNPNLAANAACNENNGTLCNGSGVCVQCIMPATCAGQDTECKTRTCLAGVCGVSFTAAGFAVQQQSPGDCKKNVCDGAGNVAPQNDNADLPNDGKQCTGDLCNAGAPSNPNLPLGTSCSQNNGTRCDAIGNCVQCNAPADCGANTECKQFTCNAGVCGTTFTQAGFVTSSQSPGDCHQNRCDGAGNIVNAVDDSDKPVDGNLCTGDDCTNGVASNPNLAANTPCGGSLVCDGAGHCVGCLAPADCPGNDTLCQTRTCNAGVCGFNFTPANQAVGPQTPGDCKSSQCDGAGNAISVNDNADKPIDALECTDNVCTNGTPSNPPTALGTPCSTGKCDGAGACVQCIVAGDCPGADTECQVRTCSVMGVCGVSNTPADTPLAVQTPGNCHVEVCDGSGGFGSVIDDNDKPVDAFQCTDNVCTNGVASNPASAQGSACTENGGTKCDGNGNCVQCFVVADCGADTECLTRTCNAGACGSNFVPAGTACSGGMCDGAGNCAGPCANNIKDGTETDVDCGGASCGKCPVAKTCLVDGDCLSAKCSGGVCVEYLVFSELQTRGTAGGNDEFIEIYNPGETAITFDNTWTVSARSAAGSLANCATNLTAVRYTGAGQVIGKHKHLLLTNSNGYDGAVTGDATYTTGITDGSSVLLSHSAVLIDALCFFFDATSQTVLLTCPTAYVCEGTPITNAPHNNGTSGMSNTDVSLERKPGGALGNGQDTNVTATDFVNATPSNPQNLSSAATP